MSRRDSVVTGQDCIHTCTVRVLNQTDIQSESVTYAVRNFIVDLCAVFSQRVIQDIGGTDPVNIIIAYDTDL